MAKGHFGAEDSVRAPAEVMQAGVALLTECWGLGGKDLSSPWMEEPRGPPTWCL